MKSLDPGRVLQLTMHGGQGGMEVVAEQLHAGLADRGWMVQTHPLDPFGDRTRLSRCRRVRQLIQECRPQVLLAHSALPSIYARACTRTPVVTVLHSATSDWDDPILRSAEQVLWRRAAAVVAVSEQKRREYVHSFPRARGLVHVIPNGASSQPQGTSKEHYDLLCAARIVRQKRIHVLIEALAILRDLYGLELSLGIAGQVQDPHYFDLLQSSIARLQLQAVVTLLGPRGDVPELLRGCKLLVHPSAAEAHSVLLLEASMAGVPAVVSEAVAPTIDSRCVALKFATDQPDSLASSINDAIRRYEELRLTALHLAPLFCDQYSVSRMVDRYSQLLARI